jgi:hypothetical protein
MEQVRKLLERAKHYIRLSQGVGNLEDAAHLKSLGDEANQAAAVRLAELHTPMV